MIKPDPIQPFVTSTLAPGSHPPGQYTKVSTPLCLWIKWRMEHKPQLLYPLKHHLCDLASSPGDQHKRWCFPGASLVLLVLFLVLPWCFWCVSWCLPGASGAFLGASLVLLVLFLVLPWCLPGASGALAPRR